MRDSAATLSLWMTGDLVLDEPQADRFFDLVRDDLGAAGLLIGHVEVPHTTRGVESVGDVPAPPADPANIAALGRAGFHVATLAGNHIHDRGAEGIADTRQLLAAAGLAVTGAGADLKEALAPAIVTRGGRRVGVLGFNCVGPKQGWAGAHRAGCAYVHILTHYELENANPGGPPKVYSFADPDSLEAMQAAVAALRKQVDIVVVAFHKGLVHVPALLAMYERPVARAAIDAGADVVIGHHAHILKGAEFYRGKPIYHGLGNFVVVTKALSGEGDNEARRAWAQKRKQLFGFTPDPDYPLYPFHPEAKNLMVAVCDIAADGTIEAGFRPGWMTPPGQPEFVHGARAEAVTDYIRSITAKAGLKARFSWKGDKMVFTAPEAS